MAESDEATFADLGLRADLLTALTRLGYEEPTPIQAETIPPLLEGHDLVGQAATGTGKTAAFALPILQKMPTGGTPVPFALVLVPTRELAVQVSEAMYKYGRDLGAKVLPIYGGQPIGRQLSALNQGVHVVVATPGRAIDHIKRGTLSLDSVQMVVLDEADEMLDMGFAEDIETILESVPKTRQTVLFSATMPPRIDGIAKRHLRDPKRIRVGGGPSNLASAPKIRQTAYIVQRFHKAAALGRILDVETPTAAIVFCRTRDEVDQLTETMNGRGYRAEALHGGMSQEQRDRVMGRVRTGTAELLMATDVAARGLDIDTLTHVVNYDVPSAPEAYVHRIGRVGRAGREGVAITLAEPREQRLLDNIERLTKQKISIEKVPSVADLRAKQIELTTSTLRESLMGDDLEDYNAVLQILLEDFSLEEVALAAVKLVHIASGATEDEREIPDASTPREQRPDRQRTDSKGRTFDKGARDTRGTGPVAKIYIGMGRKHGMRPGDVVGAVANETGLAGTQIGPIQIAEFFTTVGIPEASVDHALEKLRNATFKGKKTTVRRFVEGGR
jgi:ATP-dependent RNA helicase DeaD